jgi:glycosyltransferase involved in cell wall biosynthesis
MMKIVAISDKTGTAIDRLCKVVEPYHKNIDYVVLDCHPKRPSPEQLARVEQECRTADVIDYQYFRTAEMLRAKYEWLKDIPTVLTMNNPYSIKESDWNSYQAVVGNNKSITKDLGNITQARVEHIPIVVDPFFWRFNENYRFNKSVIMIANRIESKKGILPVALACKKLGIKMQLVGAISQPEYFKEVINTGVVHFAQECTDEELRAMYYEAGVHVCNSIDDFESGTMPILESIYCGVPVITRKIGHVPDFADESIVINDHDSEDVEHLVELIRQTLYEPKVGVKQTEHRSVEKKLMDMREKAWYSIKHMNPERRAFMYQKLYRELLEDVPVSVVLPVAEKEEVTRENLNAIANQTYKNIEIIVIDDGEVDQKKNIMDFADTVSMPVRYIRLGGKGYNLAKARNLGAIEATSDILVFVDQRMILEPDCIVKFTENIKPNTWLYGNKGVKKEFVENLSCIYRDDFVKFGMFNERVNMYGGMSQEARSRARKQGINIEYIETAKAIPKGKSSNKRIKKYEIMQMKNMLWRVGLN